MRWLWLVVLLVFTGCEEKEQEQAAWPRLLRKREVASFAAAAEALHVTDLPLEDLRTLCTLQEAKLQAQLEPFGFTPTTFLEVGELVFLARNGRAMFADLPREKAAKAREVLALLQGPEDEELRARIEKELRDDELRSSEFVQTVLANAHVVEEYDRKQKRRLSGGGGAD